jgi:hypothetical protein
MATDRTDTECADTTPHGAPRRTPRIATGKVHARGEDCRLVQLVGNLFVCSKHTGSYCYGWAEKGRMPFETTLWSDKWERRRIRKSCNSPTATLPAKATGN